MILKGVSFAGDPMIESINPQHSRLLVSFTIHAPQWPKESVLVKGWLKGGGLGGQRRVNLPSTGKMIIRVAKRSIGMVVDVRIDEI